MLFALLATVCFSWSVIGGGRASRALGGMTAFYLRTGAALLALALYAALPGMGTRGPGFGGFFLSGVIGFGLGDLALFVALPRIGARLTLLLVQCLAAPVAALAEWLWLGTVPTGAQLLCGAVILAGVGFALAPDPAAEARLARSDPRAFRIGLAGGVVAALGQGIGAVVSRHAWALDFASGLRLDGTTATFQRMLGGATVVLAVFLFSRLGIGRAFVPQRPEGKVWRAAWPWLALAVCAGPLLGVTFYQDALAAAPSAVVLSIVATAPLVVIPFAAWIDRDRPTRRELLGGLAAVAGVIGLCLTR